jgi:hypothetical protein
MDCFYLRYAGCLRNLEDDVQMRKLSRAAEAPTIVEFRSDFVATSVRVCCTSLSSLACKDVVLDVDVGLLASVGSPWFVRTKFS